jgi:hypothetical protein
MLHLNRSSLSSQRAKNEPSCLPSLYLSIYTRPSARAACGVRVDLGLGDFGRGRASTAAASLPTQSASPAPLSLTGSHRAVRWWKSSTAWLSVDAELHGVDRAVQFIVGQAPRWKGRRKDGLSRAPFVHALRYGSNDPVSSLAFFGWFLSSKSRTHGGKRCVALCRLAQTNTHVNFRINCNYYQFRWFGQDKRLSH